MCEWVDEWVKAILYSAFEWPLKKKLKALHKCILFTIYYQTIMIIFLPLWVSLSGTAFCSSVLQGIDDASCTGLKHLLLGAIHRTLHNTKEAIQVRSHSKPKNT